MPFTVVAFSKPAKIEILFSILAVQSDPHEVRVDIYSFMIKDREVSLGPFDRAERYPLLHRQAIDL